MQKENDEMELDQSWFEMEKFRGVLFGLSPWFPLWAIQPLVAEGDFGHTGYKSEFFGCASVAISLSAMAEAKHLTWADLHINASHSPGIDSGDYVPAEVFVPHCDRRLKGINLVLVPGRGIDGQEWMLNQDLVLALSLVREGDVWVSPCEGYQEVVRLIKDHDGTCLRFEIRTSHLKDYLCARGMGLRLCSYRSREVYCSHRNGIAWKYDERSMISPDITWEGRVRTGLEGGGFPGMTFEVIHISRTDLDPDDEIPVMDAPNDANTKTKTYSGVRNGTENFHIQGELYMSEWLEPAAQSARVRMDPSEPTVYFTTDADGKRQNRDSLLESGRWLWFKPTVIRDLLGCRGGSLDMATSETGIICCSNSTGVCFGVNELGLIMVFAEDMARLPDWQQQLWAGHGSPPEGKLSRELFTMQVRGDSVDSRSPENELKEGLQMIRHISREKFGETILREHEAFDRIVSNCHRFRSTDEWQLRSLAKDVARVTADSFDAEICTKIVAPPKGIILKGNKAVQNLLASRIGASRARTLIGPLIGIYDLRISDAHLPTSSIGEAMGLIGIEQGQPHINQGRTLLSAAATAIKGVAEVIESWPT